MEAACRAVSPSLFYSPEGERGARKALRERAAKAVCASCEVVEVCAAYAIACREPYGTWGGLSESDRETAYPRVDPVQAQAAYRRALAIWQERLVLPRPGSVSGPSFQPGSAGAASLRDGRRLLQRPLRAGTLHSNGSG
jgi:WhiB family redox-sensing transcriptional regulator